MGNGESSTTETRSESTAQLESRASSYISSPNDDFRYLEIKQLDKFIAHQLQPNEEFHDLVSTALDSLCRYLQRYMRPPSLKRLIKGGSMGKGTALKRNSDLDCVLIMNEIYNAAQLEKKIEEILEQLEGLLSHNPLKSLGWRIRIIRKNMYMIQIEMYNIELHESVEVDLLPTFDADIRNPYSRNRFYQVMSSYDYTKQQYCSAALAELKREFVKSKPTKLKDLIRLVKHWRKTYLPSQRGRSVPNSYLLELLTIYVWENAGTPSHFHTASLFKEVMEALCDHRELDVTWDCYYDASMIHITRIPRVVDPVNPYSNVYEVVRMHADWERVAEVAKETLQKPLLRRL